MYFSGQVNGNYLGARIKRLNSFGCLEKEGECSARKGVRAAPGLQTAQGHCCVNICARYSAADHTFLFRLPEQTVITGMGTGCIRVLALCWLSERRKRSLR